MIISVNWLKKYLNVDFNIQTPSRANRHSFS